MARETRPANTSKTSAPGDRIVRRTYSTTARAASRLRRKARQIGLNESALFRVMDEVFFGLTDEEMAARVARIDLPRVTLAPSFQWPSSAS